MKLHPVNGASAPPSVESMLSYNVRLWVALRTPFRYPVGLCQPRGCQWEQISVHEAGCRVCGALHSCEVWHNQHKDTSVHRKTYFKRLSETHSPEQQQPPLPCLTFTTQCSVDRVLHKKHPIMLNPCEHVDLHDGVACCITGMVLQNFVFAQEFDDRCTVTQKHRGALDDLPRIQPEAGQESKNDRSVRKRPCPRTTDEHNRTHADDASSNNHSLSKRWLRRKTSASNYAALTAASAFIPTQMLWSEKGPPNAAQDPSSTVELVSKIERGAQHTNTFNVSTGNFNRIPYPTAPKAYQPIDAPPYNAILQTCKRLLTSKTAMDCVQKEYLKLQVRTRNILLKYLRAHKQKHGYKVPINIATAASHVASQIQGFRSPPTHDTLPLREDLALRAAQGIHSFFQAVVQCPNYIMLRDIRLECITTGLLYLMRVGVKHECITVLPVVPYLALLLPIENQLHLFNMRSKVVTHTENLVKAFLRVTDPLVLIAAGFTDTVA